MGVTKFPACSCAWSEGLRGSLCEWPCRHILFMVPIMHLARVASHCWLDTRLLVAFPSGLCNDGRKRSLSLNISGTVAQIVHATTEWRCS